jgi:hypothetical protein
MVAAEGHALRTAPRLTIGRPLGIPVRLDASWIVAFLLVTWSLAAGFLPHFHPGLGCARTGAAAGPSSSRAATAGSGAPCASPDR